MTLGHLVSRMTELGQKAGVCPGHESVCEHVLCALDPLGWPCFLT